ncbi:MAG: precorrin-2 C(20)-methyltransferase [Coriobacteriales bacterium]|jgi:precorrin-2/cobalt-factor-2 C20-methyltransferase|nr:precorrin-2 C(20)-methyltransferase [Coriobacteriales bacterium]
MKGKLYGIGTGPGDPELLTLKAIRKIQDSDAIAVPEPLDGERTAFRIIEEYAGDKPLLECAFAMEMDMTKRRAARKIAADKIIALLEQGKTVAFITLGDPMTYSTYSYIQQYVVDQGFQTEVVPGITSFAGAAAELGVSLCDGSDTLTIIPASHDENVDELLARPGNKVIMKSGKKLEAVLDKLEQAGLGQQTMIASRVTMSGQQLFRSIQEYRDVRAERPEIGYFTVAIVKEGKQ